MTNPLKIVMGIESSCDETAVSIVREDGAILSNLVLSQLKQHDSFGGVVPEIAARSHMQAIDKLVMAALNDAGVDFSDLDAVAATCGPGLIGGVMVGMVAGKTISAVQNIPFLAVNHIEAHVLTARLTHQIDFPYLVLLVSGGHTQLLIAQNVGEYRLLGTTIDDALGECFDKSAKMMGLPYPGGPHLEKMAAQCLNPAAALTRFPLPTPMKGRPNCDFSFSGLKTAVRTHIESMVGDALDPHLIADLCYAFQHTIGNVVADRTKQAIIDFLSTHLSSPISNHKRPICAVCGGVAANQYLRKALEDLTAEHNMALIAPPLALCSDNGAMIAWAGLEKLRLGQIDNLNFIARPRWPLDHTKQSQ